MHNAMGQKTFPPRAASTVYFSMVDNEDVLAARPTLLVEVGPQPGVLRHTAAHIVDILPYVQILDVLVPQLGDQVVELLQEIDAPALVEQVVAVPKISLTGSRSALCVVVRGGHNSWWKCPRSCSSLLYSSRMPSRSSSFQFLTVVAIGAVLEEEREGLQGFRPDRIQQRLAEQCMLTFQFLMVVVVGLVREAFKVSPRDRVQQRLVEQISLTFQFRVVEVFTDQFLLLHPRTHLVPWMRLLQVFFFRTFLQSQKKSGVGSALGVGTGCGL